MINLECRMYGHHWDSLVIERDNVHWYDHLQCEACGTKRIDTIRKRTGKTINRYYKYPDGYITKKGEIKKTRSQIKKEAFEHVG